MPCTGIGRSGPPYSSCCTMRSKAQSWRHQQKSKCTPWVAAAVAAVAAAVAGVMGSTWHTCDTGTGHSGRGGSWRSKTAHSRSSWYRR